ncbi:Cyclin-F [Trichoplax sp. H2]|nr:Cyclin-F [Trichoplax sp. H2]|eukprot:RDD45684.1 Cyclin-F [Trichoplax sp. H2]
MANENKKRIGRATFKRRRICHILNLPEELLVILFQNLSIRDLAKLRRVCTRFNDVISNCPSLWRCANFHGVWPSVDNLLAMKRAAQVGNIQALVKLAIAYLYSEGLPDEGIINASRAAEYFWMLEEKCKGIGPIIWLFIRPPWAPTANGNCIKECVFTEINEYCQIDGVTNSLYYDVAKTYSLQEGADKAKIVELFAIAAEKGCPEASLELWKTKDREKVIDPGYYIEAARRIREIANTGCLEAQLELCLIYAKKKFTGVNRNQATAYVRKMVESCRNINIKLVNRIQLELNDRMRYILIDWLVEVAEMKEFSSEMLCNAIDLVDRYLEINPIPRSNLQLLGISCMVIASRYHCVDIMTIREAAWLTDNTYKYDEVVRMIGEVFAAVNGEIRTPSAFDYLKIFCTISEVSQKCTYLASFILELSWLFLENSRYKSAVKAAASLLLARVLIMGNELPWTEELKSYTGLSLEDLSSCVLHLYKKCLAEKPPKDYYNSEVKSVHNRYSGPNKYNVAETDIPSLEVIAKILLVSDLSSFIENESMEDTSCQQIDKSKCLQTLSFDDDVDSTIHMSSSESSMSFSECSNDISDTSLYAENDRKLCETAPLSPFNNEIETLYTDQFGDGAIISEAKPKFDGAVDIAESNMNERLTGNDFVQTDACNADALFEENYELLSRPLTSPEFYYNEGCKGRQLDIDNGHQFNAFSTDNFDDLSNKDSRAGFIPISEIDARCNNKLKISFSSNGSLPHDQNQTLDCKGHMPFLE